MRRFASVLFFCVAYPLFATAPVKKHEVHHHGVHHGAHPMVHRHPVPIQSEAAPNAALNPFQKQVCRVATSELGTPYQWGGTTPEDGFDCSGFSQYVYQQEGISIPRTANEQFHALSPAHHLQKGDLVFFRTHGQAVSHVGIYVGDGNFIHSPRTGQDIREDNLEEPYWKERYAGARRVLSWKEVMNHFHLSNAELAEMNQDDSGNQIVYHEPASTNKAHHGTARHQSSGHRQLQERGHHRSPRQSGRPHSKRPVSHHLGNRQSHHGNPSKRSGHRQGNPGQARS